MTETSCMTDCLMLVYRVGYRSGKTCQSKLGGSQVEHSHGLNIPIRWCYHNIHNDYFHCYQYSKQTPLIGNYLLPRSVETTIAQELSTKL